MSTIILSDPDLARGEAVERSDVPPQRRHRARPLLGWALTLGFIAVWAVTLRPVSLGGPASIVGVNGVSMTPTMHNGDLALTHKEASYEVGDIIAYHVPAGDPGVGSNVIHRIVGGDGTSGFITQGDHNNWTDTWHPKTSDVIGKVWFHVPGGSSAINRLKSPAILSMLLGVLVFVVVVWPSAPEHGDDEDNPTGD